MTEQWSATTAEIMRLEEELEGQRLEIVGLRNKLKAQGDLKQRDERSASPEYVPPPPEPHPVPRPLVRQSDQESGGSQFL